MSKMLNIPIKKFLVWLLLISPPFYITTCLYISEKRSATFDLIKVGDTRDIVIGQLGEPSHIEQLNILFSRYASYPCQNQCVERLWFENQLSLDTEAWSVEIDKNNQVIKKSHWVSP
jgi:hypothetical protein